MLNPFLKEKERMAIDFLQAMQRPEGYYLAFSGGKDSVVIKHLAEKAGVKFRAVYRVTSVDPPELVQFIKEKHPDVEREIPRDEEGNPLTMWSIIVNQGMLPIRWKRYCCEKLKESGGAGMLTITGVRWAESVNRTRNQGQVTIQSKKAGKEYGDDPNWQRTERGGVVLLNDNTDSRQLIESCYKKHKVLVNPIIDWTDAEVWEYIRSEGIPYCKLYDEGYHRLGCLGCPMASYAQKKRDFDRYPKYKEAYMRAIEKMQARRREKGLPERMTPEEAFAWWIEDPNLEGQLSMFDDEEEE